MTAISLFNGVVWFERSYYFKMMSTPPSIEEATNWLASTAALDHISAFGLKQVRGLGRAGTRTPAQVKAARAYGQRLLESIEPRNIIAFTDGASKGNPGPCGAGAYVYDNLASPWDQEDSAALGHGTNNLGELWAIGMAMQIAARRVSTHLQDYDQFRIFSDSQYSIGILTQGWKSRTHPKLAFKLRHLLTTSPSLSTSSGSLHMLESTPTSADELADRGAKKSAKKGADVNASADFERSDFQPIRNG